MSAAPHIPVLLDEVIAALDPQPGDVIVDATFGAGGYTRALLERGATVHAFDRDPDAIAAGQSWPEAQAEPARLILHPRPARHADEPGGRKRGGFPQHCR